MKKLIAFAALVTSFSAQASLCGGSTSFQDAKSVSCKVTNYNVGSESTVMKKRMRDSSETGTYAELLAVDNFTVVANSYSTGACNEGDYLTVTDKKSGSTFSTANGEISFSSADGKISYNLNCKFSR